MSSIPAVKATTRPTSAGPNFGALSFLVNGQYFKDYHKILLTLGLDHVSFTTGRPDVVCDLHTWQYYVTFSAIFERALPFDHQLSCTIIDYQQLSFSLSLFKFFMIVDDSFSRLTTRLIVHDSFSVSCLGTLCNHWPDSGQPENMLPPSFVAKKSYFYKFVLRRTPFRVTQFYAERAWKSLLS